MQVHLAAITLSEMVPPRQKCISQCQKGSHCKPSQQNATRYSCLVAQADGGGRPWSGRAGPSWGVEGQYPGLAYLHTTVTSAAGSGKPGDLPSSTDTRPTC